MLGFPPCVAQTSDGTHATLVVLNNHAGPSKAARQSFNGGKGR
jgi:hypothetical protein